MAPPVPSGSSSVTYSRCRPERGAVAEVRLEDLRQIGRRQHDVLDARRPRPRQLVRQERDARRRDHRLGRVHGQRTQPGALAADQEDRFCHLFVSASC